jgi:hypothetical protein
MKKMLFLVSATLLCLAAVIVAQAAPAMASGRVVIYDNVATEVTAPPATLAVTGDDLWVTLGDLTRATKFALKPQGVCRDQLCFPIPKARRAAFLSTQGKVTWFNLSEFARLVRQPAAYDTSVGDEKNAVWYFGPRSEEQNSFVSSLVAPNFTLPDANGKLHSLSEFRGKKVLLLTWASW